jgi:hypothetical protein
MTAIVRQKCCKDEYGYPKCPEEACDDCDDCDKPWEGGCVATSQSSTKKYKVIYNGPASGYPDFIGTAKCIYVLQLLDEDGAYVSTPVVSINQENFHKNYVDVGACPGACYGPLGMCMHPEGDSSVIYFIEWSGKARDAVIKADTPEHLKSTFTDITNRFDPNECVSILMDIEFTGSENLRYRYAETDENLNTFLYVDCPPPDDCPEWTCLEFTDGGPNHGRHVQVHLSNRFDDFTEYPEYDCGYSIGPIDGKGPLDDTDPNHPDHPDNIGRMDRGAGGGQGDGWWLEVGQWDGGRSVCCNDAGFNKYTNPETGEDLDELYIHSIESTKGDNTQKMTSQKYEWDYSNCAYYSPLDTGKEFPLKEVNGEWQITWKIDNLGANQHLPVLPGSIYERVIPGPHKEPDEVTHVFYNNHEHLNKPWLLNHYTAAGARILLVSTRWAGIRDVKIIETPEPGIWSAHFNEVTTHQQTFITNFTNALEAIGVTIKLESRSTPDPVTGFVTLGYYDALGNMVLYVDSLKDKADANGADWQSMLVSLIAHESVHVLQDIKGDIFADGIIELLDLEKPSEEAFEKATTGTPPGENFAYRRALEAQAYHLETTLTDFQTVLNELRNKIPNYYDY